MANAKKCDICEEYYDYYKTIPEKDINFNTVDLCILDRNDRTTLEAHNRLDCCPECADIIRTTIDNLWERAKNKKEEGAKDDSY